MRRKQTHSISILSTLTLGLALSTGACKSEVDDKPAAKTEAVDDKGDDGKADGGKADAGKADAGEADGGEAKAGDELALDAASSKVGFIGAKVTGDHKGHFETISGVARVVDGEVSELEVTVKVDSMKTDADKLTGHLLSPDFFDAANHPEAKFSSESISEKASDDGTHEIVGTLDMHGSTNRITFPATVTVSDSEVAGKAAFKINRKDWGIDYAGKADDLIKDDVALELDLHFPRG